LGSAMPRRRREEKNGALQRETRWGIAGPGSEGKRRRYDVISAALHQREKKGDSLKINIATKRPNGL